jgi:hypothetical protein
MLSVIMLSVIMVSVVMLNVNMLISMAPIFCLEVHYHNSSHYVLGLSFVIKEPLQKGLFTLAKFVRAILCHNIFFLFFLIGQPSFPGMVMPIE